MRTQNKPTPRLLSALIAALAFGASASAFAADSSASGITREQVRAELAEARAAGMMNLGGEQGDTEQVLIAREAFNVAQAERITAEYRAEYERQVALVEAEVRRQQIEAQALAQSQAAQPSTGTSIDGETPVESDSAAPGDMPVGNLVSPEENLEPIDSPTLQNTGGLPVEGEGMQIDILDYERSGVGRPEQLVIISLQEGDETSQLEEAARVRAQLRAMGLAADQIYVESGKA